MDCLLMGPDPSFMIKLHHAPSQMIAREMISIGTLNAKRMMFGDYLVHAQFEQDKGPCYSQKIVSKWMKRIKQSPMVVDVTPNFLSSMSSMQWNLKTPPGGVDAENAWLDFTWGQPEVSVAVLDTGILNHEALNANILPGFYFTNAGEMGFSAEPSCLNCPGFDHGTLVAGIIAANGQMAYGESIFGVAPNTTILPINVFTQFTDQKTCGFPPCLYSYLSDQLNALDWLSKKESPKVVAVNMSLGNLTACPDVSEKAFETLEKKNVSIVVAAGNQNIDAIRDYPANCRHVISVAATGLHGERAAYSNWGASVTIAAPGGNGAYGIWSTRQEGYTQKQGTSLAAPHVSGVIALLYAMDPLLDPLKVKEILIESVTLFPEVEDILEREKGYGAGILNAYKALKKSKG